MDKSIPLEKGLLCKDWVHIIDEYEVNLCPANVIFGFLKYFSKISFSYIIVQYVVLCFQNTYDEVIMKPHNENGFV